MEEAFSEILLAGGKTNSLGRVDEVIGIVLKDKSHLEELYECMFHEDAWVRMRAADAFEKVCREHPEWIEPYIDRIFNELTTSTQPSIQWHIAQILGQVRLTGKQKALAISWLKNLVKTTDVDWIVSANTMETLVQFAKDGAIPKTEIIELLKTQQKHKSKAVARRAAKLLEKL